MDGEKELFADSASKGFTVKEVISKYLAHYPLFIVSIILCVGAAYFYIRYTVPKYAASTLILVKGSQPGSGSGASSDLVGNALNSKLQGNLNNELLSLRSSSLMQRVVAKNGFNTSYFIVGKFLTSDIYLEAPFRFIPQNIKDSNSSFSITVKGLTNDGGNIEYGPKNKVHQLSFKWNTPLMANSMSFILTPRSDSYSKEAEYKVSWVPVWQAAGELASKMNVSILSEKTSIIQLDMTIENLKRGKDALDAVVREYNLSDIEDRNILSQNSIRFIDDRLSIISRELSGVEGNLENYQASNEIIDMGAQSGQAFGNSNSASQSLQGVNVQQNVAKMIVNYFNNPDTQDKLVPSTMGLSDPTLSALIGRYNELQLQKQKEGSFATANSITIKDLNNQITDVRGSILEALQNITKNLKLQESSLQQQNSQYRQFLSSLPRKERAMQEIKRKQSITEGLYLYLLQKREESAITSTSASLSNYKQIDPARGYGPIEPNTTNIMMYSAILGLLLPIGIIYSRDLLNDKVTGREDISKKLPIPIIGDIGHVTKEKRYGLSVMDRDVISEQFRIIRTTLSLLKNKNKQVILVTSSAGTEGKSFISLNLAAVFAIPGKKVALLELDLRKPGIRKTLQIDNNVPGLTNYLEGKIDDLSEIAIELDNIPTLHVFPSGPIPANPGDLLVNRRLFKLFETLKQEYDYIVIDTAPAALVSDAFILGEYSDIALYVIRQRVTLKKQLDFINDIYKTKKLTNIGIILNDVKMGGKYGYYGYGGGYGYGNYEEPNKKKRKLSMSNFFVKA